MIRKLAISAATAACALTIAGAASALEIETTAPVIGLAERAPVEGATASIVRMNTGVAIEVDTVGLQAGDAISVWVQVFNDPQNCSDGNCNVDDIFIIENGTRRPNLEGRAAARVSVMRLDGRVVDQDGTALFRGRFPVGDTSQALFGPGLVDPMRAKFTVLLRSHETAIPGQITEMLFTPDGGCAAEFPFPPCHMVQVVQFAPPADVASN